MPESMSFLELEKVREWGDVRFIALNRRGGAGLAHLLDIGEYTYLR